ncbi:MAG TPA: GNVR domain-containing protein [Vicinamibacterales bacterium]|nr:GNVR domain-containing protein [Vicinamibacterales bacterium]
MLPGKKYTFEDLVRLLLRRWWMVALPAALTTSAAVVWAKRLPDLYRSETLIMLVPQRIPESYVRTTVTARIEDRLGTLQEQILSRSRLERIITDLDLYTEERRRLPMEDVVQRMRGDISVRVEGRESFRVTYVNRDPILAQKVAERLASLFIEENLRDRENLAEATNRFLDSQLEDARRRLLEQEKKLEAYRRRYSGELPSQLEANLQAIQNAETRRASLAQVADRERERRMLLERQLAELQTAAALSAGADQPGGGAAVSPLPSPDSPPPAGSTAQQLEAARASLRVLELRHTPDHPDVKLMKRRIQDLEARLEAELRQTPGKPVPVEAISPAELARQRRMRELTEQIAAIDRQLKNYEEQDAQLREVIRQYQARVDAVPTRESELVELTRDYATLQSTYQSLLAKREESKIAANLERRNIGEQFRVLDPARVPERPFSPNRLRIHLAGAAAGLLLGLALVGFLEYRDTSFHTEEDVARILGVPVLAVVPVLHTPVERRARRRRRLAGALALIVAAGSAAAVAWWTLRS